MGNFVDPNCQKLDLQVQQLEQDKKNLEQEKQSLQEKNDSLKEQNKKLASTGTRLLERLSTIQERYESVNKENQDLYKENQDLYNKLYKDRYNEQRNFSLENKKDEDLLRQEAEELFRDSLGEDEAVDSFLNKNQKTSKVKNQAKDEDEEIPDFMKQTEEEEEEGTNKDNEKLLNSLADLRLQMIDSNIWTMQEERTYMDITQKLENPKTSKSVLSDALQFQKQLQNKIK
jgi:hypothetical protein